jgi:methylated-DNA-[protein]-cysteine S-methyltransferase
VNKVRSVRYFTRTSRFGAVAVVWSDRPAGPRVCRVFLPAPRIDRVVAAAFPGARRVNDPAMSELGDALQAFLRGEKVSFSLRAVAWDVCSPFQRAVLEAEHAIPRGWLSTYGLLAAAVGVPGGARAVGRALATNPFPLIVPCHRAITSGSMLGGYQGGLVMKRALLKNEGVEVTARGCVVGPRLFYT